MKHLKQKMKQATKMAGEYMKDKNSEAMKQHAQDVMKNGFSIKDMIGVKDEAVEAIYGQAYLLYNTGKYRDAAEVFRLLVMLNSTEVKYLLGLGACFHMLREYENAASIYTLCSIIDPNTPIPHFHVSDCYLQMGDKHSAYIALKMAIARADNKPEFAIMKERAQITLEGLKKDVSHT